MLWGEGEITPEDSLSNRQPKSIFCRSVTPPFSYSTFNEYILYTGPSSDNYRAQPYHHNQWYATVLAVARCPRGGCKAPQGSPLQDTSLNSPEFMFVFWAQNSPRYKSPDPPLLLLEGVRHGLYNPSWIKSPFNQDSLGDFLSFFEPCGAWERSSMWGQGED